MKKRRNKKPVSNIPIGKEQKETKYQPTLAERRLLEVLLNPEHRLKSVSEICSLAPCTRKVYYAAFKKEGFKKHFDRESRDLVIRHKAAILNASIRQALRGDATHAKMLLGIDGTVVEKHVFPGKDGKPQDINPKSKTLNYLERATRIAFILQKGMENKKKAEEKEDGK